MKQYEVWISDKAYDDMDAIYNYIADTLLEPIIAAKQYDRIADAILSLEQMPKRIKIINSEPERSKGYRPLYVDNYTVFYIVKTDTVHIVRVLYSASNIIDRLLDE